MTIDDKNVKDFLERNGIDNAPDYLIDLWKNQFELAKECLEKNYSESTINLLFLYFIGLYGMVESYKYVSSKTAPSGASISYRFNNFDDRWNSLLKFLKLNDPKNCLAELLPNDPSKKSAALFIGKSINEHDC